jgi:hypothetical protein
LTFDGAQQVAIFSARNDTLTGTGSHAQIGCFGFDDMVWLAAGNAHSHPTGIAFEIFDLKPVVSAGFNLQGLPFVQCPLHRILGSGAGSHVDVIDSSAYPLLSPNGHREREQQK